MNPKNKKSSAFSLIELSIVILVVGILIAGVMQGKRTINNTKLLTAKTITKGSPVPSIKNLVLWLDAANDTLTNSSGSQSIQDGDFIKSWLDQNPQMTNSLLFATETADTYPIFYENGINGLPALKFDGSDDILSTADQARISQMDNHSIFVVFDLPYSDSEYLGHSDSMALLTKGSDPWTRNYSFQVNKWTNNIVGGTNGGGSTVSANNAIKKRRPTLGTLTHDATNTSNGFKNYVNGSNMASGAASSSIGTSSTTLKIGNYYPEGHGSSITGCLCSISEIIMYSRVLNDEERQSVEKYLIKKWNIK